MCTVEFAKPAYTVNFISLLATRFSKTPVAIKRTPLYICPELFEKTRSAIERRMAIAYSLPTLITKKIRNMLCHH